MAMIRMVVIVSCQLARDWMNGIRLVRMTWMMSVCVMMDSTNQPVLKQRGGVGVVGVGRMGKPRGQFRRRHQPKIAALEEKPHHGKKWCNRKSN